MRLLVVEDDDRVSAALRTGLTRQGFEVVCARTAAAALNLLSVDPDLVLLDVRLPDADGFTLCGQIRRTSSVPIVMTTALSDLNARILGLNLGADDYLVKPYNLAELVARIRAVARRSQPPAGPPAVEPADRPAVRVGRLLIDPGERAVTVDGRPVALTPKEFDLLGALARRPGAVYRHDDIIREVWPAPQAGRWPAHPDPAEARSAASWSKLRRTLHVHVAALRQKLDDPGLIESVHGVGYRLNVAPPGTE